MVFPVSLRVVNLESAIEGSDAEVLERARDSLHAEAAALARVAERLGTDFCRAVDVLSTCQGRVVVSGVGKSGLIGRKIAATLASSGTPSLFVHAADAAHGDLGMLAPSDVVMLISHSGATEELVRLVPYFEELGTPVIAIVGHGGSPLAQAADIVIQTHVDRETCPHNVVVTTSALVTLAIADALVLAVMRRRKISAAELGWRHPRGTLGKRLRRVCDVMQRDSLPRVLPDVCVGDAIVKLAAARLGLLVVTDAAGRLLGTVGEPELRAALGGDDGAAILQQPARNIMSPATATVREDSSVAAAEARMRRENLHALVVVDADGRFTGVLREAE